jgi:hypothetical protein
MEAKKTPIKAVKQPMEKKLVKKQQPAIRNLLVRPPF